MPFCNCLFSQMLLDKLLFFNCAVRPFCLSHHQVNNRCRNNTFPVWVSNPPIVNFRGKWIQLKNLLENWFSLFINHSFPFHKKTTFPHCQKARFRDLKSSISPKLCWGEFSASLPSDLPAKFKFVSPNLFKL